MKSNKKEITETKILTTSKPFNFYLTVASLMALCISPIIIISIQQLNTEDSLSLFLILLSIGIIVYANFGQYLATISLFENRLEMNYIFPWNKSICFEFEKLTELDYKDMPFQIGRTRWYRGGKWLYLKNEKEEVCQFKYNINDSSDKIFIEELRKKCSSEIN